MGGTAFTGPTISAIVEQLTSAHVAAPSPDPPAQAPPESERAPSDMLTVEEVMHRYRIRDPRSARREIQQAGGRKIGGRWQIRLDALLAWEAQPNPASELAAGDGQSNHRREPTTLGSPESRRALPPLTSDWLLNDRKT